MGSNKIINLTGQTFGRLTVLSYACTKKNRAYWNCLCKCGKKTIVQGTNLRCGNTRSCGCLQKEKATFVSKSKTLADKVKYKAAHMWLKQHKPKPLVCEMCRERPATELSFNGKNGDWTRNPEEYQWICQGCHNLKDRGQADVKPLTKARVHRIREFYRVGAATQRELGVLFRISRRTVSRIIKGEGIYKAI